MTKAELIEKAKEKGLEVDEKLTKAEIADLLDQAGAEVVEAPKKQSSNVKSKYEDHPKFSKFKKEGNK